MVMSKFLILELPWRNRMFCQKCGNPLPKEGYICKFCGAMMGRDQIEKQKEYMKEHQYDPKLKSELYGQEKINYNTEKDKNKNLGFLIILAIILYIAR